MDREDRIAEREQYGSLGTEVVCRVCGFHGGTYWHEGKPTELRCTCCGAESGIDDLAIPGDWHSVEDIRALRGYWAVQGGLWRLPEARPRDWDILKQFGNLPAEWR
ncbi:hypothetical protein [Streptomyces sp. AM 3-1-1]|uniref:hypothetical protein n=1 Tax=Streptomyces sp. AM 3-1-1 TaxID=3028711 RepID=UPI0023B94191|nr:hypothetical protein [Streptomyces sp. AM 3-1-1]WEH29050.1 hypothetical protein P0D76_17960 [Streptomyces sp. AM 3-1-1]